MGGRRNRKMPTYYMMELAKDMAAAVAAEMPSAAEIAGYTWLPDRELAFYARNMRATAFRAACNGIAAGFGWKPRTHLNFWLWSGHTIDMPGTFIAGNQDWGTYQHRCL